MAAGGLLSTRKRGKGSGKFESHSTRIAWALALSLLLNVVLFSQWHKCGSDGAVRPGSRKAKHTERTTREGLEIRRTTIPTAPKGTNGLFTTEPIKKGDFVGFYCGEYVRMPLSPPLPPSLHSAKDVNCSGAERKKRPKDGTPSPPCVLCLLAVW